MAKIYFSFGEEDKEMAFRIRGALLSWKHEVEMKILSEESISFLETFEKDAIERFDAFLVLISPSILSSPLFQYEMDVLGKVGRMNEPNRNIALFYGLENLKVELNDFHRVEVVESNVDGTVEEVQKLIKYNIRLIEGFEKGKSFDILRYNSKGEGVKEIQRLLNQNGFKVFVDGYFGSETDETIKRFQNINKLPETGEVDYETYQALRQIVGKNKPVEEDLSSKQFWLLKIDYSRWRYQAFTIGTDAFFHTHVSLERRRPEYDLFFKMKIDDFALGYDFSESNAVICIFRVTKEPYLDKSRGEIVGLKIERVFNSPVSLDFVKSQISFFEELKKESDFRLFSLSSNLYNQIVNAQPEKPKVRKGFIRSSSFSIRDGVDPVLGVKSIAKEIADLIRNLKSKDVGKMIGIFGNWGRGKTFMVEQVWKELESSDKKQTSFIRVNFHAWKYQDTSASWAYLYEAFAKRYFEKDKSDESGWLSRKMNDLRKRFDLNRKRHGTWPLIRFCFTLLVIAGAAFGVSEAGEDHLTKAFWLLLTSLGITDFVRLAVKFFNEYKVKEKATEVFRKYFDKPSFKDLLGIQSEIQGELRHLLECWLPLQKEEEPKQRIILFVDDIDRCSEERIIQLIDALRVMLEDEEISKRVIVIAAIDERMLKRAIKWKYKELLEADRLLKDDGKWEATTLQITSEYMDKLFLSGIKLGTLTSNERVDIYKQFSFGKVSEDEEEGKVQTGILSNLQNSTLQETAVITNTQTNIKSPDTLIKQEIKAEGTLDWLLSIPVKPNTKDEVSLAAQKNAEVNFELSSKENEFLIELITNLTDATPRQIRIFYYRYMLARNLLTAALAEGKNETKFETEQRNQLLAQLLIHYTQLRSNAELMEDRKAFLRNEPLEKITAHKLIEGGDQVLTSEVMDVLEMVIAY